MTKEEKPIADLLVGKVLESVGFENECVQLNFNNTIGINIITKPTFESGGVEANSSQPIFESAMVAMIKRPIESIQIENEKSFSLKFKGGGIIRISLRPEDRQGVSAEAMTIHAQPHKIWVF